MGIILIIGVLAIAAAVAMLIFKNNQLKHLEIEEHVMNALHYVKSGQYSDKITLDDENIKEMIENTPFVKSDVLEAIKRLAKQNRINFTEFITIK